MSRKKRISIYEKEVREIDVDEIITSALEGNYNPEYQFALNDDFGSDIMESLKELDFNDYDYMFTTACYWCGILTAEPFDRLMFNYTEEDILNIIKDYHLELIEKESNHLFIRFKNPTKSPLYRFFNQHKVDGYGLNVPYSVNGLINKVEEYLKKDMSENLEHYGQFIFIDSKSA